MRLKVFGREISIFVVAAVVLAVAASAALVGYLSNSITANVAVESPLSLKFLGTADPAYKDFGTVRGGDTLTYTTQVESLASNTIDVYRVVHVISETDGKAWDGAEFSKVYLSKDDGSEVDITSLLCYIDGNGDLHPFSDIGSANVATAKIIFAEACDANNALYQHPAGAKIKNDIRIELATGIVGSYSIKLCHLADLKAACP